MTIIKYTPKQEAEYLKTGKTPAASRAGKESYTTTYKGKTQPEEESREQIAEALYYAEKTGLKVPQSIYEGIGYRITDIKEVPAAAPSTSQFIQDLTGSYWALPAYKPPHPHTIQMETLRKQYGGPGYVQAYGRQGKYYQPTGAEAKPAAITKRELLKRQKQFEGYLGRKMINIAEGQAGVKTFKTTRKIAQAGTDFSNAVRIIGDVMAQDIERRPYLYNYPSPAAPTLFRKGSKSVGTVGEFAAAVPLGTELLIRRPQTIPAALTLAASQMTYGFGKAAVDDPVQTVLDVVAFTAVFGAGTKISKAGLKKVGLSKSPTIKSTDITQTPKTPEIVELPKSIARRIKTAKSVRQAYRERARRQKKKVTADQFLTKKVKEKDKPVTSEKVTPVETFELKISKDITNEIKISDKTPFKLMEFKPEITPGKSNVPRIPKSMNEYFRSLPKDEPKISRYYKDIVEPKMSTATSTAKTQFKQIPKSMNEYFKSIPKEESKLPTFYEKRARTYQNPAESAKSQITLLKSIQKTEPEFVKIKVKFAKIVEQSGKKKGRSRTAKAIRKKYREIMRRRRQSYRKVSPKTQDKVLIATVAGQATKFKQSTVQKQFQKAITSAAQISAQSTKQITRQIVKQAHAQISILKNIQIAKVISKAETVKVQKSRVARKASIERTKPKLLALTKGKPVKPIKVSPRTGKKRIKSAFTRKNPIPTLKDIIGA